MVPQTGVGEYRHWEKRDNFAPKYYRPTVPLKPEPQIYRAPRQEPTYNERDYKIREYQFVPREGTYDLKYNDFGQEYYWEWQGPQEYDNPYNDNWEYQY